MHELAPVPMQSDLSVSYLDAVEAAREYLAAEKAPATRRGYRSDVAIFVAWCQARGLPPLPAAPETLAAFLADQAKTGSKLATLRRRVAAIAYAHEAAGHEPPQSRLVKSTMQGIARTIGAAKQQKAPVTAERLRDMVKHCDDTLRGLRDRALLLLGFAGAMRRSELVALTVADLEEVEEGLRVHVRRSKTDQEGVGQVVPVLNGSRFKVAEAVRAWLQAAQISDGPVFRPLRKGGGVLPAALSTKSVAAIVKAYAELAGLDPALFAGHSLRAGFLTSAAIAGASVFKMMEVSRHRSMETVRGYVRDAELFKDHAGSAFL